MTVVASQNNPTSEKQVRVDITRGKQVFSAADLYKRGDTRYTGDTLPNAGDRVLLPWLKGDNREHALVTSVDYKTMEWVAEVIQGNAWTMWTDDLERDKQNLTAVVEEQPELVGVHTEGMVLEHIQTKQRDADKGLAAKTKLAARTAARKTAKMIRWTITVAISLTIICAALVATYGYKTMVTGRLTDERPCVIDFSEDFQVTGKRTFSYPFKEIFGVRVIDTKVISEQTVVDIRGDSMTIVGLNGKVLDKATSWAIPVGMGERGVQILKPADVYTFVVNTGKGAPKVRTITHDAMCKG